jgi:CPA1 family monovalent cation:H+ antiporter
MSPYVIIAGLVFLAAIFGYINVRFFKLPTTIGLMLITLLYTLGVLGLAYFDDTLLKAEAELIRQIDFETVLMDYMLSFLLFAGALHTNFQELRKHRWPIIAFATIGVVSSTFLIGTATFYLLQVFGKLQLLLTLWRHHLSYRSYRRFRYPKKSKRPEKPGNKDRGRVAL